MLEKNPKILQFLSARICQTAYREKLDFSEKESQRHFSCGYIHAFWMTYSIRPSIFGGY